MRLVVNLLLSLLNVVRRFFSLFGNRGSAPVRSMDLQIASRTKSIATYEWGCAYAFPVDPKIAVPLVVVSPLYRSPRALLEKKGKEGGGDAS